MFNFEAQKFVDRYQHIMPGIVPAGDYILLLGDVNKPNNNELIWSVKYYATIRRKTGSRSDASFDFMNIEWRNRPPLLPFKIRDEKIENYTSIF